MNMPAIETLVDNWLAAYCDPDAARRLATIREGWHAQGHLIDPPLEAYGHQGISDQAATLQSQRCDLGPGFLYSRPVPAEDFLELTGRATAQSR